MTHKSALVPQLDEALKERRVGVGFALLQGVESQVAEMKATEADAAGTVVRVAQWVDLGYRDVEFLAGLINRFPPEGRSQMPLQDFLQLRMAEAFCAMAAEDLDQAIEMLDFVLKAGDELGDPRLVAIAHFWKGRSHRKKGEYDEAMKHVVAGRSLMQMIEAPKLAAVIQIQESWLLFQTGQPADALRLLDEAQAQLVQTDDALSLGNIESARGRMERQAGKYAEALVHFDRAVGLYAKRDPNHRNLARALVNAASVKRLIALQLRKRIDARAGTAKSGRRDAASPPPGAWGDLQRYIQISREALAQLQQAGEIYSLAPLLQRDRLGTGDHRVSSHGQRGH